MIELGSWLSVGIDWINNVDWAQVSASIAILGLIYKALAQSFPIQTQWVLLRIGGNKRVFKLFAQACTIATYTKEQRREWVIAELVRLGMRQTEATQVVGLLWDKWVGSTL